MKNKLENRGFTLVEIIMSLTIIALIAAAFSQLFVQSYKTIFSSGREWAARYQIQQQIETGNDTVETKISTVPLLIKFTGLDIEAPGTTYRVQQTVGKRQITIDYFRIEK